MRDFRKTVSHMIRIISLFTLLITSNIWSQSTSDLQITQDSDTIYWAKYINQVLKKFELNSIKENPGYSFRLSSYGSQVEIINDKNQLSGSLTYFVQEVDDSRDDKRVFKKTYP